MDTDFDYSWYEIPKLGKVHLGFLEALGLGNRVNTSTFQVHLQTKNVKPSNLNGVDARVAYSKGHDSSSTSSNSDAHGGSSQSCDSEKPSGTEELIRNSRICYTRTQNLWSQGPYLHEEQEEVMQLHLQTAQGWQPRVREVHGSPSGTSSIQNVDKEPNRNYFGLRYLMPEYVNSVWELLRSLIMGCTYGPECKESWESFLLKG